MQPVPIRRIFRPAANARPDALLAALSLGGLSLVLLCTWRHGLGTSPDAVNYLAAARSLWAGQGYRGFDGYFYTGWPPLYPTLLAAAGLVGVDPVQGAPLLNSLTYGLIVLCAGLLFLRTTTVKAFAWVGVLGVAFSIPLLDVSTMMWSEPMFVLLTLIFLLSATTFLNTRSPASLLVTSVAAGLACLQRYAGVAVVLAGLVLIGWGTPGRSILRRLRDLTWFGVISVGPLAAWFIRNRVVTGRISGGPRFDPTTMHGLGRALAAAMNTLSEWFVPGSGCLQTKEVFHNHQTLFVKWFGPGSLSSPIRVIGMAVVTLLVCAALLRLRRRPADADAPAVTPVGPAAVLALAYLGFLVVYSLGVAWDPFTYRHLAPAYVPLALLTVTGTEVVSGFLGRLWTRPAAGRTLGWSLCFLWLLYPLDHAWYHLQACRQYGTGGYSNPYWEHSPVIAWLREHRPEGNIYSNGPDAVYVLTGLPASLTPHHALDPAEFVRAQSMSPATYVVWLDNIRWSTMLVHDRRELLSRYQMEEIAAFPDGRVYRYRAAGGPDLSAVYRFWSATLRRHFYTILKPQREAMFYQDGSPWAYEGPMFYAFAPTDRRPPAALPVYRLWSAARKSHLFTIDEAEKDRLLGSSTGAWTCEGPAFYAWPQAGVKDTLPVYRFWSPQFGTHFYTLNEIEKDHLLKDYPDAWKYECIAWYAYGP